MKRRLWSLVLMLVMLTAFVPYAHAEETIWEECGPNAVYMVSDEGTLMIKGEGAITDNWSNQENIKKVVIEDGITSLPYKMFRHCGNIEEISIPDSVAEIGQSALSDTAYYANEDNWENGVLYCGKHILDARRGEVVGEYVIKAGTISIADAVFQYCSDMTSIVIPNTIKRIAMAEFAYCNGLTQVIIPYGVTEIDAYAFRECENLKKVAIPTSVTKIGYKAFAGCDQLSDMQFPDSLTSIASSVLEDTAYYEDNTNWNNGTLYNGKHILKVTSDVEGVYEIPDGTLCIAGIAFQHNLGIKEIKIPPSVVGVEESSFSYMKGIEKITVDNDNPYYTSENGVLFNKDKTNLIQYPLNRRGESYNVPDSVTKIESCAFKGDMKLAEINVSENNSSYSSQDGVLFNKDKSVLIAYPPSKKNIEYTVPSTVEELGDYAFNYCRVLSALTLPDKLKSLGRGTFCYSNIVAMHVSDVSHYSSNDQPFDDMEMLSDIYFTGDSEDWAWTIFEIPNIENMQVHCEATGIPEAVIGEFAPPVPNGEGNSTVTVPFECIPYNCTVIAAFYTDGVLTGTSIETANSTDTSVVFTADGEPDSAKVFVWNGIDNLYPLGEAKLDSAH